MRPLVSAVITSFNYGRFVARAIESVLAQDYSPTECVVVDDGSTDNTPEVLERFGNRIRAIRQENRGVSSARNTGIRACTGEYVAILDADDYWNPRKVSRQMELIQADPDTGVVGCWGEAVDGNNVLVRPAEFRDRRRSGAGLASQLRAVATRSYWVGCSGSGALVPRRVLDQVGLFDETLAAAEDWDMWLRIGARYVIRNVPEPLATICEHGTGTFRNPEKMETNQWKVFDAAVARWPDVIDRSTRRRMRAMILADAGGEYIFRRNFDMALRRYVASVGHWPMNVSRWKKVASLLLKRVRLGRSVSSA